MYVQGLSRNYSHSNPNVAPLSAPQKPTLAVYGTCNSTSTVKNSSRGSALVMSYMSLHVLFNNFAYLNLVCRTCIVNKNNEMRFIFVFFWVKVW